MRPGKPLAALQQLLAANPGDDRTSMRPANGVYLEPKVLRLRVKTTIEYIAVVQKDMPNFFVEALTISGGKVYTGGRV